MLDLIHEKDNSIFPYVELVDDFEMIGNSDKAKYYYDLGMSKKDLKEYVESHKRLDVYDGLSLVEVLVLYIATNYYYNRCEYESEIKLGAQLEENRNMKYRSMINASKGIPLI